MEFTPEALARIAYDAVVARDWWLLASAAVLAVVFALRTWGGRLPLVGPRLAPWLAHPVVSWALPILSSSLAALVTALVSGQPIGAGLLAALKVAGFAVMAYVGVRKVAEAQRLGAEAAAGVTDKAAAVAVLRGPQP